MRRTYNTCRITLIIFLLILAPTLKTDILSISAIPQGNYYQKTSLNSSWQEEGLINVLLKKLQSIVPSSVLIINGTKLSGSLTSLFSNDSDFLVVNSTGIYVDILLEFAGIQNGGILKVDTFYVNTSSNTTIPLNISIYDSVMCKFTYLGFANSTIHIDGNYITADGRLILKLWGRREGTIYVSYAIFSEDPVKYLAPVYYKYITSENVLLHKVEIDVCFIPAKIYLLNLSYFWRFLYAEPEIEWNFTERSFLARDFGVYRLYFEGLDKWNCPDYVLSKLVIINKRGEYLPFDAFRVYYRTLREVPNSKKTAFSAFEREVLLTNLSKTIISPILWLNLTSNNFNFLATKSDLSDLRFLQEINGSFYLIPHFIRTWNGKYAVIFLRPLLINNHSQIIMQYGNPTFQDLSLTYFTNETLFYDDFTQDDFLRAWNTSDNMWRRIYVEGHNSYAIWHIRTENKSRLENIFKTWSDNITLETTFRINISEFLFIKNLTENYLDIFLKIHKQNATLHFIFEFLDARSANFKILYENVSGNTTLYSTGLNLACISYLFIVRLNLTLYNDTLSIMVYQVAPWGSTIRCLSKSLSNISVNYPFDLASFGISFYNLSFELYKVHILSNFNPIFIDGNISDESFSKSFLSTFYVECTNYTQLYYPVFLSPKNAKVNVIIKDVFNNTLSNSTFNSSELYVIILDVCSWKFKNNRDDIFVHIQLTPTDNPNIIISEWVAPQEIVTYLLQPREYQLKITYQTGETLTYNLSVHGDMFFLLNGTVIGDVITSLQNINSTLINMIHKIDIKIENVNATIKNQTMIINLQIENLNASINEMLLRLKSNISSINATIETLLVNISSNVKNMNSILNTINSTLMETIINTNSSICSLIIDLRNNIMVINTTMGEFQENITAMLTLINSTLLESIKNLCDIMLTSNATINEVVMNISSYIMLVNTTLGMLKLLLNESIIMISSNMSKFANTVLSYILASNSSITLLLNEITNLISSMNSTFYNITWKVLDSIVMINTSIYTLLVDLNSKILSINSTFNEFLANISAGIMLLNAQINLLNCTLLAVVYDCLFNLTTVILVNLNETKNLAEAILSALRIYEIRVYNTFTNELVEMNNLYKILVNGTPIIGNVFFTVAKCVNITLIDYWSRRLWSRVINETLIIARIPFGSLIIVNERKDSIETQIRLNSSEKSFTLLIPPFTAQKIYLPINGTYFVIVRISPNDTLANASVTFSSEKPTIILKISMRGLEEYQFLSTPETIQTSERTYIFIYGLFSGIFVSGLTMIILRKLRRKRLLVSLDEVMREILHSETLEMQETAE